MSSRRTSHACLVALALALAGAAACDSNTSEPRVAAEAPPPAPAASVPPPAPASDEGTGAAVPASQWETRAPNITDADIPPLPTAPFPLARPAEVVRAVYVFAAKHPEVLSHVPCFCGCESRGHKHNDDCFVTERDAKGRPTKWEPHGLG
jgi:hypothetical protein